MALRLIDYAIVFVDDEEDPLGGQLWITTRAENEENGADATEELAHAMFLHRKVQEEERLGGFEREEWHKNGVFCEFMLSTSDWKDILVLRERRNLVRISGTRELEILAIIQILQFKGVLSQASISEFIGVMNQSPEVIERNEANVAANLAYMNRPFVYRGK
ncbi:hypothetical protein [Larkinella rosea]|uniref:Uncharacterized protein n=1 Tax=Larkinella rosea TaxID=2025312 RepID=A0A3P1BD88_9BACT|nr:hypothetical protein [Larkinella rosea]RRA98855.1 hypothetical protein EHT25_28100 [Larkinella rosea]